MKRIVRVEYMVTISLILVAVAAGCNQKVPLSKQAQAESSRPNVLLIVADDMGYSDVGAYGGEIATPNINALAAEGVLLTQFHVAPNCGPTRGAMLSGVDYHRAGLGGNPEVAAENQRGQPGYEGHLREDVVTMAELLRDAGYHTYMTGKWHLGKGRNMPSKRGFEQTFALLNGGASHWPDQAPLIPGSTTRYVSNGAAVEKLPDDFYSSKDYTDRMIEFIGLNHDDQNPFFAYLAYTAPHNPLHVPAGVHRKVSWSLRCWMGRHSPTEGNSIEGTRPAHLLAHAGCTAALDQSMERSDGRPAGFPGT